MEDVIFQLLDEGGFTDKGWEYESGYGIDGNLICPCGYTIEQDGRCPDGCVSPLRQLGLI